eukprot:1156669-Pelagomonas_calceolata.AAC.8
MMPRSTGYSRMQQGGDATRGHATRGNAPQRIWVMPWSTGYFKNATGGDPVTYRASAIRLLRIDKPLTLTTKEQLRPKQMIWFAAQKKCRPEALDQPFHLTEQAQKKRLDNHLRHQI